jgi:hypothetical protein
MSFGRFYIYLSIYIYIYIYIKSCSELLEIFHRAKPSSELRFLQSKTQPQETYSFFQGINCVSDGELVLDAPCVLTPNRKRI